MEREELQEPIWFVMDRRAEYDTDAACVMWSAGNVRPSRKSLKDFSGMDACLCVQENGQIRFVERIK